MKNLFKNLLFLNFITMSLAAHSMEYSYSTTKCNIEKYQSVVADLLKNNDEHALPSDNFNASVGDGQYFETNVKAGLTTMVKTFYSMNPRTGKTLDGTLVFKVDIQQDVIKTCSLKAILVD